jgi:hypothetical protein
MPQFHRGMNGVLPRPNPPKIVILILNEVKGKNPSILLEAAPPPGAPFMQPLRMGGSSRESAKALLKGTASAVPKRSPKGKRLQPLTYCLLCGLIAWVGSFERSSNRF